MAITDGPFRMVTADELTEDELQAMNLVLQIAFQPWPAFPIPVSPIEHLRWKTEGPRGKPSWVTLTEIDGRVGGTIVHTEFVYRVRGQDWRVLMGTDAAIHPDFQNRGLYKQRQDFRARTVEQYCDMNIGLSLNPWALRVSRQRKAAGNGQSPLGNTPRVLVRVQHARALAAERAGGEGYPRALGQTALTVLGGTWSRLRHSRTRYRRGWEVREVPAFDKRADALFEQAAQQFEFIQVRDRRFLNWRYADLRGGDSTILVAEDSSELLGYVVFKRLRGGAQILDLLALPGRTDVASSLLDQALAQLRDAHSVYAWLPRHHPYYPLLASRWFADTRRPTGVEVRALLRKPEEMAFLQERTARIHFMLGDMDIA